MEGKTIATSPIRILSLDGGGVRCVMQLAMLARLESLIGPLHRHFDIIIGSSVGALIGCSVAMGTGMREATQTFYRFVDEVFSRNINLAQKARRLSNLWSFYKHDDARVVDILKSVYGDTRLGNLQAHPMLVLCYNPQKSGVEIISSDDPRYIELPVWEVCKAATAAPLYFKPSTIQTQVYHESLLDGGLVCNNPAPFGLTHALRVLRLRQQQPDLSRVLLVSLGSGRIREEIKSSFVGQLGMLTTAPFFGGSEANHQVLQDLLRENYHRLQVDIPFDLKGPDRSYNTEALHDLAEMALEHEHAGTLKRIAWQLVFARLQVTDAGSTWETRARADKFAVAG
jgi:patatin-like phospholipase/acyl hydrolase